jgi:hypothetical protein
LRYAGEVNFFGHAVVARWESSDPAFVLGAMLPDFATMLGARPPSTTHAELAAGIRFHHRTDEAFHDSATFRALTHEAFDWLSAAGVRRGSARAVAHIGTEIVLDATLADDADGCDGYLLALENAVNSDVRTQVGWENLQTHARFEHLCRMLCERGVMTNDVAPELVAERLKHALAGRPRLALEESSLLVVRNWVKVARPSVAARAGALIAELKSGLSRT